MDEDGKWADLTGISPAETSVTCVERAHAKNGEGPVFRAFR